MQARAPEVTLEGRIVWEYENPHVHDGHVTVLYEMRRYPRDYFDGANADR